MGSKANGALMRITPLPVWGHKLSQHDLVQAVYADAQLTHPNKTCMVNPIMLSELAERNPLIAACLCFQCSCCTK